MFNPEIELRIARQRHEDMLRYAERQQIYQQLKQSQPNRLEQLSRRLGGAVRAGKARARQPKLRVAGFSKQWAQIKKLVIELFLLDQNEVPAYPQGYLLRRDNHETH